MPSNAARNRRDYYTRMGVSVVSSLAHLARLIAHAPNRHSDRGGNFIEYALLVSLIAAACVLAVTLFGNRTQDVFDAGSAVLVTTP